MLQCLAYIQLLLQQLPCGKPVEDEGSVMSFAELWQILLLLALKQDQPVIRWIMHSGEPYVVTC